MANNFDKILELVNAGNQMGLSNTIKRDYGIPLDFTSVQESYEAAVEYAATSAKAYVGQILAAEGIVYIITEEAQEDGTYLKPVGSVPEGDNLSIEVVDGKLKIHGFGTSYYKYVAETGSEEDGNYVEAHYEKVEISDENPWKSGLEPKVVSEGAELVIGWFEPNPTTIEGVNDQVTAVQGDVSDIRNELGVPSTDGQAATGIYKEIEDVDDKVEILTNTVGSSSDSLEDETQTLWAHVNDHETRIGKLETKEDKDTTYSVASDEQILVLTGTEFSTKLGIKYADNKISLVGINDEVISEFDASDFVADSVLTDADYDANTQELVFTWNIITGTDEDGNTVYKTDRVPVGDLVDTYTAGAGIEITNNEVAIKLADVQGNVTLNLENGLKADIDLKDYAKSADVVAKTTFEDFKNENTQVIADAKAEVVVEIENKGYAVATEVADTYAEKANVYTKDEVYSKSETDTAIADAVKNATGGESASDVLIELNNYKKAVNRELWGAEEVTDYTATASRIDDLETADAAQDTLIASNTILAQKGVDDAKAASDAVTALTSGQVATNKTNIETLTTQVGTHTTDIADLKSKVGTNTSDIAALKADDVTINETLTSHGTDITSLKTSVAAHETAINTTLPNAIAEKLATSTFNETIANYYTKTEADTLLTDKADKSTTYTKTEVDNLLANLDQTEINEAIAANAEAIATLNGDDVGKSARTIAVEEIAKVVNSAPEDFDTLKEIADYIASDKTGAAEINNKLSAHDAILAGIGGTDEPATVSALIDNKIAAIPAYELPSATAEILGGVKSAADVDGNVVANAVYVDVTSNIGSVKKITTDILENGAIELVLFGGNAQVTAAE